MALCSGSFNSVKLCITERVIRVLEPLGLKGLKVWNSAKGPILNVALPIIDIGTDAIFAYEMYKTSNFEVKDYMVSSNYQTDTCIDHIANVSYTPYDGGVGAKSTFYAPSDNVTCIDSKTGLIYTPLTFAEYWRSVWFGLSGNNAFIQL